MTVDLKGLYNDKIIRYPNEHQTLSAVLKIRGMENLIRQCYPDFIAYIDRPLRGPRVQIIRKNLGFPQDFITTRGIPGEELTEISLNSSGKILTDFSLKKNKELKSCCFMLSAPELGNNININFLTVLQGTKEIGDNCRFEMLITDDLQSVGKNFSAYSLTAPQMTKYGENFKVTTLDAPNLIHPANIQYLKYDINDIDKNIEKLNDQKIAIDLEIGQYEQQKKELLYRLAECQKLKKK